MVHAGHLAPFRFTRRPLGELDIKIQIAFCGICHTDLHQIRNDWRNSTFPMVPGCALTACSLSVAKLQMKSCCDMHQCIIFMQGKTHCVTRMRAPSQTHINVFLLPHSKVCST